MNLLKRFKLDIIIAACLALINILCLYFICFAGGDLLVIIPTGLIMGCMMLVVYKMVKKLRKMRKNKNKKKNKEDRVVKEEYVQEVIYRIVEVIETPVILVDEEFKTLEANDSAREHFISIDMGADILEVIKDEAFVEAMKQVKLEPHELLVDFIDNKTEYKASISPILYDDDIYHYLIRCKSLVQKRYKSDIDKDKLIYNQMKAAKAVKDATNRINELADDISDKTKSLSIQTDAINIKQNAIIINKVVNKAIDIDIVSKSGVENASVKSKNSIENILNKGQSKGYKKRVKNERDENESYREI